MRMAVGKGLTTPALLVNGFGGALLMTTQGDHHLARKGSPTLLQRRALVQPETRPTGMPWLSWSPGWGMAGSLRSTAIRASASPTLSGRDLAGRTCRRIC